MVAPQREEHLIQLVDAVQVFAQQQTGYLSDITLNATPLPRLSNHIGNSLHFCIFLNAAAFGADNDQLIAAGEGIFTDLNTVGKIDQDEILAVCKGSCADARHLITENDLFDAAVMVAEPQR